MQRLIERFISKKKGNKQGLIIFYRNLIQLQRGV